MREKERRREMLVQIGLGQDRPRKKKLKEKNLGSHHFNEEHSVNFILFFNQVQKELFNPYLLL
jgi:hypothetical protein